MFRDNRPATQSASSERARVAELRAYALLDAPLGPELDDLTGVAGELFDVPIAFIAFLDETRAWLKATQGTFEQEVPRQATFCDHAIRDPHQVTVVPDTRLDPRHADNPLVKDPGILFYAGAPLVSSRGHALGTLCLLDTRPRELSAKDIRQLRSLARQVMLNLDLRRRSRELEEARQAHRAAATRYQKLFEHALDGVLQLGPDGRVRSANPAACAKLRQPEHEVVGRHRDELLDTADARVAPLLERLDEAQTVRGELRMRRGDGSLMEAEVTAVMYPGLDGDEQGNLVFRDLTQRRETEARMVELAYYDALTRLPNRTLLRDRIEQALRQTARDHRHGALMFLDLDNFKQINDARGHAVGDEVLREVARRLQALLRSHDTVARLGGDEFVVLIQQLPEDRAEAAAQARSVAEKVRTTLDTPMLLPSPGSVANGNPAGSHTYRPAGSVGISLFPVGEQTPDDLLREADTAMYQAKKAGRNGVVFYEPDMQRGVEERLTLETDLRQAVERGELLMHVQPQFDAQGMETGAEVLLRWQHPTRGLIPPSQFIPLAEQTGAIVPIGEWVIERACTVLASLHRQGVARTLSVNISPRQFRQSDFPQRVQDILQRTGAPSQFLVFEVTESLLVDAWEAVRQRMQDVVDLGVRFSIDNFGTGSSSLPLLQKLPVFEIKIDRRFVSDNPGSEADTAIVRSLLSVADHLGLEVVGEGVETAAQDAFLRDLGCTRQQGFRHAHPQPVGDWLHELRATV